MIRQRKFALLVLVMIGSLAAASSLARPPLLQTATLATLSGTVDSTAPFKAAQVYIRNVDKRILYMVYTNAGQFRAVSLFPGNYEVSVSTKGLESDVQKLVLKSGDSPEIETLPSRPPGAPAIAMNRTGTELRRDLSAWPRT